MIGRRLRVLQITQYLDIGGLETVIIELSRRLDSSCFQTEVLCLNGFDPDYIQALRNDGIPVHLIQKTSKFDMGYFSRVARFIKREKFDIVHAHSGCFFYAALFVFFALTKKFVFTAHGLPIQNGIKDLVEDNLASICCDAIVSVSDEIKNTLARRMPLARKKLVTIINGIDSDRFCPFASVEERNLMADHYGIPKNAFIVGSVGRLEPVKNYSMLLRSFARFQEMTDKPVHLVLVGEGGQRSHLEHLTAEMKLVDKVHFLGMQYRVHEIIPLFDIFALSSFTEGTSVSLLEAQACGVPAVVTDVGGNDFVVREKENGFLCQVDDDAAMVNAFLLLRNDAELCRRMSQSARARILEAFDLNSMVQRYEELYRDSA